MSSWNSKEKNVNLAWFFLNSFIITITRTWLNSCPCVRFCASPKIVSCGLSTTFLPRAIHSACYIVRVMSLHCERFFYPIYMFLWSKHAGARFYFQVAIYRQRTGCMSHVTAVAYITPMVVNRIYLVHQDMQTASFIHGFFVVPLEQCLYC